MPPTLNSYWLSALILAALLLSASGAPVTDAFTESPTDDPSGEGEMPSDLLSDSPRWGPFLAITKHHKKEFEDEFKDDVKYHFLENYKISSATASCPMSNFSKEACLLRLVHGLQTYEVLLRHVLKEYPSWLILSGFKYRSDSMISLIKEKMRHPERVSALSSNQEERLMTEVDNPNTFHRKMTAHSILRQFHFFLVDSLVSLRKKELLKGSLS
ncbi:interleukin-6-like [Scomber japonicus]|uniref:interleukin-6-like n=1 Tax=Scomber japonicus TaxID=13676 RepID=UPI0023057685|nr:interleukin-6-like [Scomber japonicus]